MPDCRPDASEHAAVYAAYVARVPDVGARASLATGLDAFATALDGADHAYAPGKWTVRQVVQHVADAERIFATRALRIARGDATPLPGFDENTYADATAGDTRPLSSVLAELRAVRAATLALVDGLPDEAWSRVGTASGHAVSVRALVWITAGHALHHEAVLRERYGVR